MSERQFVATVSDEDGPLIIDAQATAKDVGEIARTLEDGECLTVEPIIKLSEYDVFYAGSPTTNRSSVNIGSNRRNVLARDHRTAAIIAASGSNHGKGARFFVQGEDNDPRTFDKFTLKAFEIVQNDDAFVPCDFQGAVGNRYTPKNGYVVKQIAV